MTVVFKADSVCTDLSVYFEPLNNDQTRICIADKNEHATIIIRNDDFSAAYEGCKKYVLQKPKEDNNDSL